MIAWFKSFDPDVIVGWNVIDFDFRLLHKRAEWHNMKLMLGRADQPSFFRSSSQNQQGFISIPGRVVLDGIDTLKTATYHFRSWSLESVSQELLGEGKEIHNVHDRMDEINRMYRSDKPSLAKYNLQDCVLVNKIFEHTHLLAFAIERSRLTGVELIASEAQSQRSPIFICHKFIEQVTSHPICTLKTGLRVPAVT